MRKVSGIVFLGAALAFAAMVLFWIANAVLANVKIGEHIGRQISASLPGVSVQFAKAHLHLSRRGLAVRAEQLHLQNESGGLYAPNADFFFGVNKTQLALHSPRITITYQGASSVHLPLPLIGEEWVFIGNDAVFVADGFDNWLPVRAADFTVVSRGGTLQVALAEQGGDSELLAKWQNGTGIARLVIVRDNDLPMRRLQLTAHIGKDAITIAADIGQVSIGKFSAPSINMRAALSPVALAKLAAGLQLSSAVSMSANIFAAEVGALPKSDISIGGVLQPAPDGNWQISARHILLGNDDGALSGGGLVFVDSGGALSSLQVRGKVAVSAAALYNYFPSSPARKWLQESLVGGDIGAAVFAVSGTAQDLANGRGWNATAAFTGGDIIIGAQWPKAQLLAGALFLHDDRLTIIGEGVFADLPVADITAVIDNFAADAPASLQLHLRATPAPLAEYKRAAFAVTALRAELAVMQTANFSGYGELAVFLTVPLLRPPDTQYRVSLAAREGVYATGNNLPTLTALSGAAVVENGFLRGSFGGLLYDKPAAVSFGNSAATLISTISSARAFALAGENAAKWQKHFSGNAAFTLYTDGKKTTLRADLQQMTSDLPPPLDKIGDSAGQLRLLIDGDKVSIAIIAAATTVRLLQTADGAAAGINTPLPLFGIAGAGAGWDLDAWMQLQSGKGTALSLSLSGSRLLGMRHSFLQVRMPPRIGETRHLIIRSPHIVGTAAFSKNSARGIFDKLQLQDFGGDNFAAEKLFALSLSLHVRQLGIGGITLGAMRMHGIPAADGWRLSQMHITDGANILRFAGFGGRHNTTLHADLHAPDLARLLAQFGLTGLVESGTLAMRGDLSWDDAPSAPSLAGLRGSLRLDAEQVRYLKLQDSVSGLLALFSPASLFSLGFTELGKPGVRFDINGDVALMDGFAASESLTMRNEDIHITLGGRTDMIRRRHDIRGRVLPGNRLIKSGSTVSLGATLAAGAAINPPVFLAGVLLGKILQKPLSEIGAYDYEITGDWQTPDYRELGFSDKPENQ